jgi:hypothetical protein
VAKQWSSGTITIIRQKGDLFIYVPEAKFLMVIDSVTSGCAPFQGFDLSTDFHQYLKVFDEILAYKVDTFVGGHLTDIGRRGDHQGIYP